jgi:hypothetical protein
VGIAAVYGFGKNNSTSGKMAAANPGPVHRLRRHELRSTMAAEEAVHSPAQKMRELLEWLAILVLVLAPQAARADVKLPPPVRVDARNPAPRPDLVAFSSAVSAPLIVDVRRGPERWTASVDPIHPEKALRAAFAQVIARFDPPLPVRLTLKAMRADVQGKRIQLRLVVYVADARDRTRLYQGPGDSQIDLDAVHSQAELYAALLAAVDDAARATALQFSARSGAPEQSQSAKQLWVGGQLGGLSVLGASLLWQLRPGWLAQVAANPIGPRMSVSAAAGRRLHGDDAAELRGWVGLTAEMPIALVKFCDTTCTYNQVTRFHSAWLLEFAWVFGEQMDHRFGLQAGMLVGLELPQWSSEVFRVLSPWGGVGYWTGW